MTSVLSQLYYYSDLMQEEQIFSNHKEDETRRQAYYQHFETFREKLNAIDASLKKEFGDIIDEQAAALSADLEERFLSGFQLGARMMIELYQNS